MTTRDVILKYLQDGGNGTKVEIAEETGASYSYTAKVLNDLVFENKARMTGKTTTGADVFVYWVEPTTTPFTK